MSPWNDGNSYEPDPYEKAEPFLWMDEKPHFRGVARLALFITLFWLLIGLGAYLALR